MNTKTNWPAWIGISIASVFLVLFLYTLIPPSQHEETIELRPFKAVLPKLGEVTLCEQCSVILHNPERLRPGGTGNLVMEIELGSWRDSILGKTTGDQYHLLAETRMELPGVMVSPSDYVSRAAPESGPMRFEWVINPSNTGMYQGNLWLYLNLVPLSGEEMEHIPVLARAIQVQVSSYLGMDTGSARSVGLVGVFIGCLLIGFSILFRPASMTRHT